MKNHFYHAVLSEITNHVRSLASSHHTVCIGIDGCGGSGKSTLADELSESLDESPVVHMDDFYKPRQERNRTEISHSIGWQFDWQRLESEVLRSFKNGNAASYRRYDWNTDRLDEIRTISAKSSVIVEGVYVLRPELLSYYAFRIWVDCPKEIRLLRGIDRDGEQARSQWEDDWMMEEEKYVHTYHPHLCADTIVCGT